MSDFFNRDLARAYDERNRRLAPIADNMHFLMGLVLQDLPASARILCVGAGTGAEILSLSKHNPAWRFFGVDPSASMLAVCRERLQEAGVSERCELLTGYVRDVPPEPAFDAAVSLLVGHFVKKEERAEFYGDMQRRLKPGGSFVNTEISGDLDAEEFPAMLQDWKRVQALMGATPESLAALPALLHDTLTVLPPAEVERLMRAGGIRLPIRFFQSFMISGWHARKD